MMTSLGSIILLHTTTIEPRLVKQLTVQILPFHISPTTNWYFAGLNITMLLSTVMAVSATGILIYKSEGKIYEVVGGAKGGLNLRHLP